MNSHSLSTCRVHSQLFIYAVCVCLLERRYTSEYFAQVLWVWLSVPLKTAWRGWMFWIMLPSKAVLVITFLYLQLNGIAADCSPFFTVRFKQQSTSWRKGQRGSMQHFRIASGQQFLFLRVGNATWRGCSTQKPTVSVFKALYCDQSSLLGFRKVNSMTEDCEYLSKSNKHTFFRVYTYLSGYILKLKLKSWLFRNY